MTGPTVLVKFRHLAPERLAAAKQTFAKMEEMGLCQKTSIPWLSPLHIVLKMKVSPEVQAREQCDQQPCWLSHLEIYQIKNGQMPTQQQSSSSEIDGIQPLCRRNLRGRGSPLSPKHRLDCLQQNGLVVQYDKCTFGANEVLFVGYRINHEGVHPLPKRVAVVQNFLTSSTIENCKNFWA
ncbi:uncharacterized protein [Palaemon carinicauda]|uniref:uncharacterized protein n=1 Tax=Palaemon carinicauda TaxID=392227 RepID=UPI0035B6A5D2